MKFLIAFISLLSSLQAFAAPELKQIIEFKDAQVTGVTVSSDGRLFANFPRWRDGIPYSVVEVKKDNSIVPYPNAEWNTWHNHPEKNHYTCIQSVVAHNGSLYVLDPASPVFKGVIGNAKLYVFDLATNQLKHTFVFDSKAAPKKSYLNDLRVDDEHQKIYMTDSGLGAIVILDLKTGKARRALDQDPSVLSENVTLKIEGKDFLLGGKPPQLNSDGIEYNPKDQYLYYHALTGYTLYRVPVSALNDSKISAKVLAAKVENLGKTPAPDGMFFDQDGNLYLGDLEKNAIVYRTPSGEIKTLIEDPRIEWADTFTIDPDHNLVFTTSKINKTPFDQAIVGTSFPIFKISLNK